MGIDVEMVRPKIELIQHKFLSEEEQELLPAANAQWLTLLWSCKEAVYKWYGKGGVDFKRHIIITNISINDNQGHSGMQIYERNGERFEYTVSYLPDLCLAWVI